MDTPSYHVISLGEKGILLFYESDEILENQKRKWYFSLIDTTLTEKWVQTVPLTNGMSFHTSGKNLNTVVMLFTSDKSQPINYELITFHYDLQQFNLIAGAIPEKATIAGFATNGNSACMAINLPKSKCDFLFFDVLQGKVISIGNPIEGDVVVNELGWIPVGNVFIAVIGQSIDNKLSNYHFIVFDHEGTLMKTYQHTDEQHRTLHAFTFEYDLPTKAIIIIGSFDTDKIKKEKLKQKALDDTETAGLFYLRFSETEPEYAHFVEFNDFKNIYAAMAEEDLIRTRQQQSRSNNEQQAKPEIAFRLFNPTLVRRADKLVYAAEAFRPQYRIESRIEYDFYGRPIPYTYSVFEGYNFFNTILGTFDNKGELVWTNHVEIPDLLSFYLQPHALVQPDSTSLVICVIHNGMLNSSVIDRDGMEMGNSEQTKIVSDFADDRLIEEDFTSVLYWYGTNYLAMGYQKIINNKLRDNNPRTVFYLNKIGFHE